MPNNPFHWSIRIKETMEPKTHFKRTCKTCLEFHGKAGCTLPFRRRFYRNSSKLFLLAEIVRDIRKREWK